MSNRSTIGELGEKIAAKYLINLGHRVVEKNKRYPWGELDIVSVAPDGTLVIVEVKTMRKSFSGIVPEDNMTDAKIKKLKRTALFYANENQETLKRDRGWRIDFISVVLPEKFDQQDALTINIKNCEIKYVENAVS